VIHDARLVHIPRTAGTSIATAFDLEDSHRSAADRRKLDPEGWESAFVFAVVRNPWWHAASTWHHRIQSLNAEPDLPRRIPFAQWVREGMPLTPIRGLHQLDIEPYVYDLETGDLLIDCIYDFGRLPEVVQDLRNKLHRPGVEFQHHHRAEDPRPPWRDLYDGDSRLIQRVGDRASSLLDSFGYTFSRDQAPGGFRLDFYEPSR